MRLLREYIRQIIRESEGAPGDLAAVTFLEGNRRCAVIYDPKALERVPKLMQRMEKDWMGLQASLCDNVIKGFIDVAPGGGKCNGAWEVYRSAGPGMGKIVYSVGYALTPNGRLMSDRLSVSDTANSAWMKAYNKSQLKKLPLDDDDAHNPDGTIKYDHPNHTEDLGDDCSLYRGPNRDENPEDYPHLQYAYEGTGEEQALLDSLRQNHERELKRMFPERGDEVEGLIRSCGGPFFSRHYAA